MPKIHPKTWDDGVMPLEEMPLWKQRDIAEQVVRPRPPDRYIVADLWQMESRAWWEWHWSRGRKLKCVPGPGRRAIPRATRLAVIARDGYVCQICGGAVEPNDLHIDHIHPVSRGGTNDLDNLQVTDSRCNLRKGASAMSEAVPCPT